MARESLRDWIRSVERAEPEEQWTLLCYLAGQSVTLDGDDLHASLRRAALLLAAGGDPRRRLQLYGRAVTALAGDLDTPAARAELAAGLAGLVEHAAHLPGAAEALRLLQHDSDLAWQCFALGLLAEELGDGT